MIDFSGFKNLSGIFSGGIRLISDIRAKNGPDAICLSGCGRFKLADLSDVTDMTYIDLSGIDSLEGSFDTALSGILKHRVYRRQWHPNRL